MTSKEYNVLQVILGIITIVLVITLVFQIVETETYRQENKALKEAQIVEYDKGYRDAELEYIEDYIDVMEAYWELFAETSALEERIKWLKNQDHNIDNIVSDLDDLMEWTIRYYEVESQVLRDEMELSEYIKWKDHELYARIEREWQ